MFEVQVHSFLIISPRIVLLQASEGLQSLKEELAENLD